MPQRQHLPWVAVIAGLVVEHEGRAWHVEARPSTGWAILVAGRERQAIQVDPGALAVVLEPTEAEATQILLAYFPTTVTDIEAT